MKEEKKTCEKYRTEEEKIRLGKRLNVIGGQVNGIKQMLENDRSCEEILIQISAITKSLNNIGNEIMKGHLSHCVVKELTSGNDSVIDEVVTLFDKYNK